MVETLKKVNLTYSPFSSEGILRVRLEVVRKVPYISSEWPSRILLWLSRRYHVILSSFSMLGDDSFTLVALIVCDEDYFRQWSRNSLLDYVSGLIK